MEESANTNIEPVILQSNLSFSTSIYVGGVKVDTIVHKEVSFLKLFGYELDVDQFDEIAFDNMCQKLKNEIFKKEKK